MSAAAIWEPPPGLLKITTCWPSCVLNSGPIVRMNVSTAPPAGNGITIRTGLVGQAAGGCGCDCDCAWTALLASRTAAPERTAFRTNERLDWRGFMEGSVDESDGEVRPRVQATAAAGTAACGWCFARSACHWRQSRAGWTW